MKKEYEKILFQVVEFQTEDVLNVSAGVNTTGDDPWGEDRTWQGRLS